MTEYDAEMLPVKTKRLGFFYVSSNWYYGKVSMAAGDGPLKQENATFISEEEEEDLVMNCESGDIRVGHEYQSIPRIMTFVGVQNDDYLLPVRRVSGVYPIAAFGNLTANELLDDISGEQGREMTYIRVGAGIGIFMGMIVLNGCMVPFRVSDYISLKCSMFLIWSVH